MTNEGSGLILNTDKKSTRSITGVVLQHCHANQQQWQWPDHTRSWCKRNIFSMYRQKTSNQLSVPPFRLKQHPPNILKGSISVRNGMIWWCLAHGVTFRKGNSEVEVTDHWTPTLKLGLRHLKSKRWQQIGDVCKISWGAYLYTSQAPLNQPSPASQHACSAATVGKPSVSCAYSTISGFPYLKPLKGKI